MSSSITIERKRVDCNALPKGWQREEVLRKSGISAGKVDVYYYSPTGKKIESKPQLARYLGDAIDIGAFDFHSGKFVRHLPPPSISLFRCSSLTGNNSSNCGVGGSDSTSMPPPPPQCSSGVITLSQSVCSSPSSNAQLPSTTNANILQSPTSSSTSSASANTLKRKYKSQSQSQIQNQNQSQTHHHQVQGIQKNANSSSCSPTSSSGAGATATSSTAISRQQLEFR